MDAENINVDTPKRTRRLGLRRCSSVVRTDSVKISAESAAKRKTIEVKLPASSPKTRLPQSDMKINYKDLEQNCVTPKNKSDLQRLAVSTNCRPYRLSLSKKVREKMTKKRLEFYLANEVEREDSKEKKSENETYQKTLAPTNFASNEELNKQIEIARKELTARQEHLEKVKELREAIALWKSGFSAALLDLQKKIEPSLETARLLESLHIPAEMIKYIND